MRMHVRKVKPLQLLQSLLLALTVVSEPLLPYTITADISCSNSTIKGSSASGEQVDLLDAYSCLFSAANGLLDGWSQGMHNVGWSVLPLLVLRCLLLRENRSITPGYVPMGTVMYHGTTEKDFPKSGMEWLA